MSEAHLFGMFVDSVVDSFKILTRGKRQQKPIYYYYIWFEV